MDKEKLAGDTVFKRQNFVDDVLTQRFIGKQRRCSYEKNIITYFDYYAYSNF